MKYPKLWNGPSPVGESLVRALQATGEPFLRASTADGVNAGVSGGFQEVTHGGAVEYQSSGRVRQDGKVLDLVVASASYKQAFLPLGACKTAGSNKRKALSVKANMVFSSRDYDYPNPSHPASPHRITWQSGKYEALLVRTRAFSRAGYVVAEAVDQGLSLPGAGTQTYPAAPANRVTKVDPDGRTPSFFVSFMYDVGDKDVGGAPLSQPMFTSWTWSKENSFSADQYLYPTQLLPNALPRLYLPPIITVVGQNKLFSLVFSNWMYTTNYTDDVSARARLFYSQTGGDTWTVRDVTDVFLSPSITDLLKEPKMTYAVMASPPSPPNGGTWSPPLSDDFWGVASSHRQRATGLPEGASETHKYLANVTETPKDSGIYTYTVQTQRVGPHTANQLTAYTLDHLWAVSESVAIGNNEALLTASYVPQIGGATSSISAIFRLTPSGMTMLSKTDPENFSYVQALVYLGGDALLAKRVNGYGLGTTNADVTYELSLNRGVTWSVVPASGLPELRKNRFFGSFTRIKPYESNQEGKQGIVLTTAYDPSESSYFVYESLDAGRSWERRARLAKTEQFYRVDTMLASDGGGNFMRVFWPGLRKRPSYWNDAVEEMAVRF